MSAMIPRRTMKPIDGNETMSIMSSDGLAPLPAGTAYKERFYRESDGVQARSWHISEHAVGLEDATRRTPAG